MDQMTSYVDKATNWLIESIPGFVLALFVLIAGWWIIKKLIMVMDMTMSKSGLTPEITSFLNTLISIGLKVLLVISVAGMVGVNTAAFVGVLAAGGLAIGLALQGSLGNFAAGIIIVMFKPYKIGDWVEIKEKFGKVIDIQIFNTVLNSPGNKTLIIPNGEVISGVITNFSRLGNIRIEMRVLLSYQEDYQFFSNVLLKELSKMDKVLKEPVPEVGIEEFGETNLVVAVRPYVHPDHYWEVYYDTMARVKRLYHEHGLKIGFQEGLELHEVGN
ncbi:MAG: mechanosensitive ion channel family protein [Saprospiraceae bacterium]|nr:MAG: MscS Mechanosensitive ion channel [Bacteroidetes bacterium OLB9]MCO6463305.1 mechanosensitive ion channel family protein [Saprospiraceae bacterium]MCZ2336637.1 mechanosensitive ion channel family protein [Chitinophagales bacterium]